MPPDAKAIRLRENTSPLKGLKNNTLVEKWIKTVLLYGILLTFLLAGSVSAQSPQSSGAVALMGTPTVDDDQVTVQVTVKNTNGLPALNLTAENFTLSESAQAKQLTSADSLPIALAVIVDLSHGSDVDLIQAALRAYFSTYYRAGDPVIFYVLGPNQNTSTPEVSEPGSLDEINQLIDGLTVSTRFYSISKALTDSLTKLESLQSVKQPAHALYVGSFLNDPSEASQSATFKLAGIPLHVLQAHRYRHLATPALQKLAAEGGGLFADDLGGTSVLDGSTPVNLVKTIYDVIAASRTVYTLSYRTLNTNLVAHRDVTLTVALSADEQASTTFAYDRVFQQPVVEVVSGSLTPRRLPSRDGDLVKFDVALQPVTVRVSYPDGVARKVASLRLDVLDAGTGNILQSNLVPAPAQDSTGNYVINWALDDFKTPGTSTSVNVKVTVTDELGLSGEVTTPGIVTVGALPPLPTPTPLPTATPLPPTALPTAIPLTATTAALGGVNVNAETLLIVIAVLAVVILLLLIALLRVRRQRGEDEEELDALRNMPTPVPLGAVTPQEDEKKRAKNKKDSLAEGEEEKVIYGRLYVLTGLENTPEIVIDQEEFVIGRRAENGCNYVINEPFISPRHCMIITHKGSYAIRDLNTKNGTFINGERIPRDRDVVVPIGSEVSITERIKLELWDPDTVVNMETRRAGQTDVRITTRANTSLSDDVFRPLAGIRYADDDESEIEDDYSPI